MANTITLTNGTTSVEFKYIKPETALSEQKKVFTKHVLSSGSSSFDEATNKPRVWNLRQEVFLTSSELTDLQTLFDDGSIQLVDDWLDAGTYTVFFKMLKRSAPTYDGRINVTMELEET